MKPALLPITMAVAAVSSVRSKQIELFESLQRGTAGDVLKGNYRADDPSISDRADPAGGL
jgi:hypothetical protein